MKTRAKFLAAVLWSSGLSTIALVFVALPADLPIYSRVLYAVSGILCGLIWTGFTAFAVIASELRGMQSASSVAILAHASGYPERKKLQRPGSLLDKFAWFCKGETRGHVLCAAADLRRAVREMRKKKCGRVHIMAVRVWHTISTIVPVMWDGFVRMIKSVLLIPGWIRQLRGPEAGG